LGGSGAAVQGDREEKMKGRNSDRQNGDAVTRKGTTEHGQGAAGVPIWLKKALNN